ncbi:interleukin-7 receptor subunit alpha isoform X2 [Thalassophryne amazonica]|nr:interleukin-7 receptor subunit alpha isoform X2 [Thalassophryne amazonica]
MKTNTNECREAQGQTISILSGITAPLNLTVHLTGGATIQRVIDLRKIVKPRSPRVRNITFNLQSKKAVIHFSTPYDFLRLDNQLFQLHIWSSNSTLDIQNVSSSDTLSVGLQHLHADTEYWVRLRSIPAVGYQGTWSDWSPAFSFSTHAAFQGADRDESDGMWLIVSISLLTVVTLVLLTSSIVFFWKQKLYTCVWLSIPHPKHTLLQIYRPNKGLLLSFTPEVFSALNIYPVEPKDEQHSEEVKSAVPPDPDARLTTCISHHCMRSSSARAESAELCSLQSSSGEHEYTRPSPQPNPPRPVRDPHTCDVREQDEDYVTMSSFYQSRSK